MNRKNKLALRKRKDLHSFRGQMLDLATIYNIGKCEVTYKNFYNRVYKLKVEIERALKTKITKRFYKSPTEVEWGKKIIVDEEQEKQRIIRIMAVPINPKYELGYYVDRNKLKECQARIRDKE